MFAVREGGYADVPLDGLHFAWAGHSPGPLHEGNVTAALIIDESATPQQREALATLWRSGSSGLPFDILNSVTATWLETVYAPFDVELAGINTKRSELGMSELAKFSCDGLSFDTSGKYAEYADFEYAGPG